MKVIKEKTDARKWLDSLGTNENGGIPFGLEDLLQNYANEKVKEAVKEIQSQAKDAPIKENWIGFNAYK